MAMRLLRYHVHWTCIAKSYLTLEDMAIFELAVDNHDVRLELGLLPVKTNVRYVSEEIDSACTIEEDMNGNALNHHIHSEVSIPVTSQ